MKVLVVREKQVDDVAQFLEKEGYTVDLAASLIDVEKKINVYSYDCIVLDIRLLGDITFKLIDQVTKSNKVDGLIVLSAALSAEEKVKVLDSGADDILTDPLHLAELSARIRAVIRRRKFQGKSKTYFGNLIIDIFSKTVFVWSNPISLTRKEFEILLFLISNKDRVIAKSALAEYLWGEPADHLDTYDALFTHLKNLRKKLKEAKAEVEFKSIYGVGYQIIEL